MSSSMRGSADGRLSVRAQYRSTASNSSVPILEKSLFSNGSCAFGKWTHVVVVISGASVRIYLDGEDYVIAWYTYTTTSIIACRHIHA